MAIPSTDGQWQAQARDYAKKTYPITSDCEVTEASLEGIKSEIASRQRIYASSGCKNKLFNRDDCKQREKNYIYVLEQFRVQAEKAIAENNCADKKLRSEEEAFNQQLTSTLNTIQKQDGGRNDLTEYGVLGLGLAVVLVGLYKFVWTK